MSNLKSVKIAMLILLMLLIHACFNPITPMSYSLKTQQSNMQSRLPTNASSNRCIEGRVYNVTLITGDYVLAIVAENGTIISVAIRPADPTKLGRNFLILKIRNSTYVIPDDLNVRKFDLELFNIELLIRDGYTGLSHIPVIVEHHTDVNALIRQFKNYGANVTHKFSIVQALVVKLPKNRASKIYEFLKSSQDVHKVWLDSKVYPNLDESAPLIGASDAWDLGVNGSGVRIAVIDTGIDSTHEDFFFPNGTSKVERAVSFIDYEGDGIIDEDPYDYHGHGTHVASIAAGTGAKSNGRFKGIAYGASLWNVKVLNSGGWGYTSWVIAGVEYATLGPDYTANTGDEADILSLSLGAEWWTDGTDPLSMACDAAVDFGRVVVVAAGNREGYFHIGVPATARKVITVGASDKYDYLAWFSSCGPTIDFRVKPDIVAPGVDIWAACAKGSLIEYEANHGWLPGIDVDGDGRYDYVQLSGTSMSTPHVSGVAALLKQLNPSLKPVGIKNVLISTANDIGYNVYQQGGGRVNVTSAIDPPVLVDPATISFGVPEVGKLVNSTITFTFTPFTIPSDVENITLSLSVILRDISTGGLIEAVTLNATTITIPLFESKAVLLTLNTSLPKSLYEGKVVAEVVDGPWINRTVHTIFGFALLNNLTVEMLDRSGLPAAYRQVVVFKHNATSYEDMEMNFRELWTDERGIAQAYVADGEFYIIGIDQDYSIQSDIWTIADKIPIYENVHVTLDEREAGEVSFNPVKPKQVFAAKRSSISYTQEEPFWYPIQLWSLWYYPSTALTYTTCTSLSVSFSYEYYDMEYFNVANPEVIDAPEWHNLMYWNMTIKPPITYVANYSSLVKRTTEYRIPMTPKLAARFSQHKWSPFEYLSAEYSWIMNVPKERVEWLTPDIYYYIYYNKYRDPPWISTPYWEYYGWYYYQMGDIVYESWGAHPLSTHFEVGASIGEPYSYLYIWAHFFQDVYGHFFYNWERRPAGHIKIFRNDTLIYELDEDDTIWYEFFNEPVPSKYRVIMDGWSDQHISTASHVELEFTVSGEVEDYQPPLLYINVLGLDFNNTHEAGEVVLEVYVDDPRYSSEADVTVEYSTDDGVTWNIATALTRPPYGGAPYPFYLGVLNDTYVSLRVNATDLAGNSISQTTIRGFYVKPGPAILIPSLTIEFYKGWNSIGMSLNPKNRTVEAVLSNYLTYVRSIFGYYNRSWVYWIQAVPSPLEKFEPGYGYYVETTENFTLVITGDVPAIPTPVSGWNLIAIPGTGSVSTVEYLDTYYPKWSSIFYYDSKVKTWRYYIKGIGGNLNTLEPGKGYWIVVEA